LEFAWRSGHKVETCCNGPEAGHEVGAGGRVIGIGAAFGLTRLMTNLLFGVTAHDPMTFAAVAALLVLVALLACYIPARRATLVDPIVALRYE